jgi:hypothetical protein
VETYRISIHNARYYQQVENNLLNNDKCDDKTKQQLKLGPQEGGTPAFRQEIPSLNTGPETGLT